MPTSAIICNCGTVLRFVAKTQSYKGIQYGDSHSVSHFYTCPSCKAIWQADCGLDIEVDSLKRYSGHLSEEQLAQHVLQAKGHWYPKQDEENFEPLVPKKMSVSDSGKLKLPISWAGAEVLVVPAETNKGKRSPPPPPKKS